MQAGNDKAKKKWKFEVAEEGVITWHLALAAEKRKSGVFKGRPEARKWLRGEQGEPFHLNGHKRKISPQLWSVPRGGGTRRPKEQGGGKTVERWDEAKPPGAQNPRKTRL